MIPQPSRIGASARVTDALLLVSVACAAALAACSGAREEPAARAATPAQPPAAARDTSPEFAEAATAAAVASVPEASPAAESAAAPRDPTIAPTVSADTLFSRPVVIGASASDGFGISVSENGARPGDGVSVSLADILRVANASPHTVEGYASSMAFANPGPILSGEMKRALAQSPSIVVGIDFLFWFVYGTSDESGAPMGSTEERLANLDRGLAQVDVALARGIPVVIGDIPDMKATIGKMLSREMVPDASTLDAVNARIREWAQSRPGVRVFGLHESVLSIGEKGSMRAGGVEWSVSDHGPLLLRDELHPSFPGLVAIASAVVELAASLLPEGSRSTFEASFDLDPMMVRRRLLDERAREMDAVRSRKTADER